MKIEEFTKEWASSLPKSKRQIVSRLKSSSDFLVKGDAMPFIEEIASAYDYNIVYVKLQTLDDLRGTPVVKESETSRYFELDVEWQKAIERSEKKSLLIFNIDDADDRLVNALKSIVENNRGKYFVGLICNDETRDLENTTVYDLVKPVILWES